MSSRNQGFDGPLLRLVYVHYEKEMQGEGDQRSFRRAAYETHDLRVFTLSDEWALSAYPSGLLCMDVRVVHARPQHRLDFLEAEANQKMGYRVLLPPYAPLYGPSLMTPGDWLRLVGTGIVEYGKSLTRPLRRRLG